MGPSEGEFIQDAVKECILAGVREEDAEDRMRWKQMIRCGLVETVQKKNRRKFKINAFLFM